MFFSFSSWESYFLKYKRYITQGRGVFFIYWVWGEKWGQIGPKSTSDAHSGFACRFGAQLKMHTQKMGAMN